MQNSIFLNSKIQKLIKKTCKNKKHIKLTVGYLTNENMDVRVFNEQGDPFTQDTYIYEIGSITKTFTTTLFSKFIFDEKVALGDPIERYLSSPNRKPHCPTLENLATHTAGYPVHYPLNQWDFIMMSKDIFFGGKTEKENPMQMDSHKMNLLLCESTVPNQYYKWNYSSFGISLLGYIVGLSANNSYWNTMNNFIASDLELDNTYLGTVEGRNLHGYSTRNEDCGNWIWSKENLIAPASALSSTAFDLLKYAKININEEKTYIPLCHMKHAQGTKKYDMGLGWWINKDNNVIMHTGGTGCFSSFLGFDKEKKTAVVVLCNYRLGIDLGQTIGYTILDLL